jgi:hypothetical protein
MNVYCAYLCWSFSVGTQRRSERLAAVLMGVFFITKIGSRFMGDHAFVALASLGCTSVVIGTFVMLVGLAAVGAES